MSHADFCRILAERLGLEEGSVKRVVDGMTSLMLETLSEGDDVKLKGLGTFYPRKYRVLKGDLDIGTVTRDGMRATIQYRPSATFRDRLTQRVFPKK